MRVLNRDELAEFMYACIESFDHQGHRVLQCVHIKRIGVCEVAFNRIVREDPLPRSLFLIRYNVEGNWRCWDEMPDEGTAASVPWFTKDELKKGPEGKSCGQCSHREWIAKGTYKCYWAKTYLSEDRLASSFPACHFFEGPEVNAAYKKEQEDMKQRFNQMMADRRNSLGIPPELTVIHGGQAATESAYSQPKRSNRKLRLPRLTMICDESPTGTEPSKEEMEELVSHYEDEVHRMERSIFTADASDFGDAMIARNKKEIALYLGMIKTIRSMIELFSLAEVECTASACSATESGV